MRVAHSLAETLIPHGSAAAQEEYELPTFLKHPAGHISIIPPLRVHWLHQLNIFPPPQEGLLSRRQRGPCSIAWAEKRLQRKSVPTLTSPYGTVVMPALPAGTGARLLDASTKIIHVNKECKVMYISFCLVYAIKAASRALLVVRVLRDT